MRQSFELRRQIAALPANHPDRPALEHARVTAELAELRADRLKLKADKQAKQAEYDALMKAGQDFKIAYAQLCDLRHNEILCSGEIRKLERLLAFAAPRQTA